MDEMNLMILAIVIGCAFGPLAAIFAFLVTYQEYHRHYPKYSKIPIMLGLKSAATALIVVAIVTFLAGYFLPRLIPQ
jgi:hypothetical protein